MTDLPARVFQAIIGGDVGRALRRVSDDFVLQLTTGPVYCGPEGLVHLVVDRAQGYHEQRVRINEAEPLGGGYQLLAGELRQRPVGQDEEVLPGAWLGHVEGDVVTALIYHRTRDEVLRSLPRAGT